MIPARKSRLFAWWFARHVRGRIRRAFREVRVHGLEALRRQLAAGPLEVVSNHTSWWDPMFCIYAAYHLLEADGYALMDAKNLRRLPFLGRVGGFGVDLDERADGAAGLRYAAGLLDRPGRLVWIFPQGRERPLSEPLSPFRAGAAVLAARARVPVVPVGLRYEIGATELPTMWASFGAPLVAADDIEAGIASQRAAVAAELDRIDRVIRGVEPADDFATVLAHPPARLGPWAERLLALFTRLPPEGGR
jgi:1-acyl-sn-glycerol-3-phosphate acyltransferase